MVSPNTLGAIHLDSCPDAGFYHTSVVVDSMHYKNRKKNK